MIPLVTKREPFIQLVTDTIIQQGKSLLHFLNSITNSTEVKNNNTALDFPFYYEEKPQSGFLPRGIDESAWIASLFLSGYVFCFLYQNMPALPFFSKSCNNNTAAPADWLTKMPAHIQEKVAQIRALSALNSQLSFYHVLAGVNFSGNEQQINKQLDVVMRRINDELIDFFDAHPMTYHTLFFNNAFTLFETEPERMISGNAAFIQLIALANSIQDDAIRARAHRLYARYLHHSEIACYTNVPEFGLPETRSIDWSDRHANNYIMLPASYFKIGMLVSQDTLHKMMSTEPVKPNKSFFHLYTPSGVQLDFEEYPLEDFFAGHYPLFLECTERVSRENHFAKLLGKIIPHNESMRNLFLSARQQRLSEEKLIGSTNNTNLLMVFAPRLRISQGHDVFILDEKHCQTLLKTFKFAGKSPTDQAKMLLSLATFFIKSAGEHIFGTREESPEAIRIYAWALMNKAYQLDRTIFKSGIEDWSNVLLSAREHPQNSDILARTMIEHHKLEFPDVLAEIFPPAWYE